MIRNRIFGLILIVGITVACSPQQEKNIAYEAWGEIEKKRTLAIENNKFYVEKNLLKKAKKNRFSGFDCKINSLNPPANGVNSKKSLQQLPY